MAKGREITKVFKIQAPGGKATPAPPIGPALGQHGVNPGQFIQQFNEASAHLNGQVCVCEITVYSDRSFTFILKKPPAAELLKAAAGVPKGSGEPHTNKVAKINLDKLREIAEEKSEELTSHSTEAAMRTLAGQARSMGIEVEGIETIMGRTA